MELRKIVPVTCTAENNSVLYGNDLGIVKVPIRKQSPFASCIGHAASAVGCGESYQLLLLEQASPKFIIKRLSEFDKFTGSVTANNGWYVVLE